MGFPDTLKTFLFGTIYWKKYILDLLLLKGYLIENVPYKI